MVRWLRLHSSIASTAGGTGSIPGWGTKIPHAAQHSPPPQKREPKLESWAFRRLCSESSLKKRERGEGQQLIFGDFLSQANQNQVLKRESTPGAEFSREKQCLISSGDGEQWMVQDTLDWPVNWTWGLRGKKSGMVPRLGKFGKRGGNGDDWARNRGGV